MTAMQAARAVDVTALRSRIDADAARIRDVRTPAEFETGHMPGSCDVPLDLLREHRHELARHLGDEVVVTRRRASCTGSGRW